MNAALLWACSALLAQEPTLSVPPVVTQAVEAEYPEEARAAGVSGTVVMQLTVDEYGHVSDATVLHGVHPLLDQAALDAVRRFHFSPAEVDGTAVPVLLEYRIAFVLPAPLAVVPAVPLQAPPQDLTVTGLEPSRFETVVSTVRQDERMTRGTQRAASSGRVSGEMILARPLLRPGDVMESVPGMITSQHSGEGKANQYYLRGFNLDHGTDFATTVAGMPANMVTNAHGQGYTDLNFVIPELVEELEYRKGPYFADEGDLSSAGAAHLSYGNTLRSNLVSLRAGLKDVRVLMAASPQLGPGTLLGALEVAHLDGPWMVSSDFRKVNAVLRYSMGTPANGWNLTAMLYRGTWTSTDQVPQRALDRGLIRRLGSLDPSDGGNTSRASVSAEWGRAVAHSVTRANAYAVSQGMDLYSNFTYLLDDPVHGDQFHQAESRTLLGGNVSQRFLCDLGPLNVQVAGGLQSRTDVINGLDISHTQARRELHSVRQDQVLQSMHGAWVEGELRLWRMVRGTVGLRTDVATFHVQSSNVLNSGNAFAFIHSPKVGVVLGPWAASELFLNAGTGFHSNDARGTTIRVDPSSGEPVSRVRPLVRTRGAELGLRSAVLPGLQTSLSLWGLELDKELVFSGDAGTTEESRASRRLGLEWSGVYAPTRWASLDWDVALSDAQFTQLDAAGQFVPGALERVFSAGVTLHDVAGVFASVRVRHFGRRALVEDNTVRSGDSTWVNAQVGYEWSHRWRASVEALNLLDSRTADIEYFYRSRLAGEPAEGVQDVHTHPAEPLTVRVSVTLLFDAPGR